MVVAARAAGDGAAGDPGEGPAAEARAMPGGVDAARQAGDDGKARGAKIARQPLGETQAGGRGIARADDGDRWQPQRGGFAAHGKQRPSIICSRRGYSGSPSATKATPSAF